MKVTIKSMTGRNRYDDRLERTVVMVDGAEIGSGDYGGEPEDNCRFRDYKWVEPLLKTLGEKLGAEVTLESESFEE
jgi:hypothetical protein